MALPQVREIRSGASMPVIGRIDMPKVSPGQISLLPYWGETWMAGASHPLVIENGRRKVAYPSGELSDCQATSATPRPAPTTSTSCMAVVRPAATTGTPAALAHLRRHQSPAAPLGVRAMIMTPPAPA